MEIKMKRERNTFFGPLNICVANAGQTKDREDVVVLARPHFCVLICLFSYVSVLELLDARPQVAFSRKIHPRGHHERLDRLHVRTRPREAGEGRGRGRKEKGGRVGREEDRQKGVRKGGREAPCTGEIPSIFDSYACNFLGRHWKRRLMSSGPAFLMSPFPFFSPVSRSSGVSTREKSLSSPAAQQEP